MADGFSAGAGHEIGVWVSGFYGSGKSSFTKYLGLALDDSVQVDGVRFLKHLQDRLHSPQAKALLGLLQQNVAGYESAFGEIKLDPRMGPTGPVH